jgi:hypothetical protein
MIACCGSSTRIPGTRPHVELAGVARAVRRRQGRRDPGAPARGRRAPTTQPTPKADVGRPGRPQRPQQAAARGSAGCDWCRPEPCCAGTPNSSPTAGPTRDDNPTAHPPHSRSWPGCDRKPRLASSRSISRLRASRRVHNQGHCRGEDSCRQTSRRPQPGLGTPPRVLGCAWRKRSPRRFARWRYFWNADRRRSGDVADRYSGRAGSCRNAFTMTRFIRKLRHALRGEARELLRGGPPTAELLRPVGPDVPPDARVLQVLDLCMGVGEVLLSSGSLSGRPRRR